MITKGMYGAKAVPFPVAPEDRMTKEQAEQAMRSFEFPGWKCTGIKDLTDLMGTWMLRIEDVNSDWWCHCTANTWLGIRENLDLVRKSPEEVQ